jgi:Cys-rich protein (TIGR01571 family)
MARLHLNSCANPVLNVKARTNAISILLASIALIMLHSILISLPFQSGGITIVLIEVIPLAVLDLLLILYFFVLLVKTRTFVRQMYKIEGSVCDDVTSSVFCTCCTAIQMGYHTADYETYTGVCCSSTGLPPQLQALSPHSIPPPEFIKPFSMC